MILARFTCTQDLLPIDQRLRNFLSNFHCIILLIAVRSNFSDAEDISRLQNIPTVHFRKHIFLVFFNQNWNFRGTKGFSLKKLVNRVSSPGSPRTIRSNTAQDIEKNIFSQLGERPDIRMGRVFFGFFFVMVFPSALTLARDLRRSTRYCDPVNIYHTRDRGTSPPSCPNPRSM